MQRLKIGSPEYRQRLWQFFKDCGGNPGTSMTGVMGWYIQKEREFRARLAAAGVEIEPADEPVKSVGNFRW